MGIYMRKTAALVLIIFIISINITGINAYAADGGGFSRGLVLDVARTYYTVGEIKSYVNMLSRHDNSYLQLHFTDDENVGIECRYLEQTADGNNNGKYLTRNEVKKIMEYCRKKNVEFVPEIEAPSHMGGFITLASEKFGKRYAKTIAPGTEDESTQVDFMTPEGRAFIFHLYKEYAKIFKDCRHFSIGFDEYTYRIDERVDFANRLGTYLRSKGFTVRMYNDSISSQDVGKLNKKTEIYYWEYPGKGYATFNDLTNAGFHVINGNSYYLYFVPCKANVSSDDLKYSVGDLSRNWSLDMWNEDKMTEIQNPGNVLGAAIAVWNEDSAGVSKSTVYEETKALFNAMSRKLDTY